MTGPYEELEKLKDSQCGSAMVALHTAAGAVSGVVGGAIIGSSVAGVGLGPGVLVGAVVGGAAAYNEKQTACDDVKRAISRATMSPPKP